MERAQQGPYRRGVAVLGAPCLPWLNPNNSLSSKKWKLLHEKCLKCDRTHCLKEESITPDIGCLASKARQTFSRSGKQLVQMYESRLNEVQFVSWQLMKAISKYSFGEIIKSLFLVSSLNGNSQNKASLHGAEVGAHPSMAGLMASL